MQSKLDLSTALGAVPTFASVHAEIDDLPALLWECIEAGTSRGREVAKEEAFGDDRLDPWLVSTVLRGRIRKMLKKRGVDSMTEDEFNLSSQPLIGLLFHYKGYSFRVLKAVKGKAPGYGNSQPRKRFYDQVPTVFRDTDSKLRTSKLNVLVLYDEDENGAATLILACPSIGAKFSHEVGYHWIEPLVHPAVKNAPTATPETQEPDHLSDVVQPISLPERQKRKA